MYKLIDEHGGRGIYSGDSKQLLSIDSGASFSFQQQYTKLKFSVMSEIVRQNKQLKPAVNTILNNNIKASLQVINAINPDVVKRDKPFHPIANVVDKKMLQSHHYHSEIDYIAKDYASRTPSDRENTLIITQINADKEAINQAVHCQLMAQDELGKTEQVITVLNPVSLNKTQLHSISSYHNDPNKILSLNDRYYSIKHVDKKDGTVLIKELHTEKESYFIPENIGKQQAISLYEKREIFVSERDKIVFNKTIKEKDFIANSEWTVKTIKGNKMTLTDKQNREKIININQLDEKHFTLGYTRTDYGVQGASSEHAIIFEKSAKHFASARSHYVGVSRARNHVTIVTDDLGRLIKNLNNIKSRTSATELVKIKQQTADKHKAIATASQKTINQLSPYQLENLPSVEKAMQHKAENCIAELKQEQTKQVWQPKEQARAVNDEALFQKEKTL